ncbi:transcription factor ETV7-like [Branchiostoma floridae x Branchiostoma belcheri]
MIDDRTSREKAADDVMSERPTRRRAQVHTVTSVMTLQIPLDPLSWDLRDVRTWLRHLAARHDITVDLRLFHMNGRGMCLMNLQGFEYRVPVKGHILYEDFWRRVAFYRSFRRCKTVKAKK